MGRPSLVKSAFFFMDHGFLANEIDNSPSILAWGKVRFLPSEWCQGCWVLLTESPTLAALQSVAVLVLCVDITNAYFIEMSRFYNHSIYMGCFLLHVKFEGALSFMNSRNRTTTDKKLKLEIENLAKKKPQHFYTPLCCPIKSLVMFNPALGSEV